MLTFKLITPIHLSDDRINLSKPLPKPFLDRPRIGMRL